MLLVPAFQRMLCAGGPPPDQLVEKSPSAAAFSAGSLRNAQAPRPVPEGSAGPMVLSPMDFCIPFIGSLVHLLGCNSMLFSANCSSCFLAVEHTGHCQASLRPASSEPSCCQAFHHPFSAVSTFMTALRQGAGSPAGLPGEWGSNGRKIANWPSVRVKSNPTTFLQGIRSP